MIVNVEAITHRYPATTYVMIIVTLSADVWPLHDDAVWVEEIEVVPV